LNTTGVNTPPRVPEKPLDKALSAKIRAQLSDVPQSAAARLSPETIRDMRITSEGGKVILEGNVKNDTQKRLAETEARRVPGVVAVENRLNIRDTSIGAPASGQTGEGQSQKQPVKADHPETSPDF
jgi:osmotically-inducible protein OsmY